jgi:carboxymethylenebutenolidase
MSEPTKTGPIFAAEQQFLNDLWDEHIRCEFQVRDVEATLETTVPDAYVNGIPAMVGGAGREQVGEFYARHFIPQIPPDIEIAPVSRTIGTDQLVDEMILRFTHSFQMD